ncbi:MAG: diguanylate cyclase domain-containing protein [Clostridium sp.]|uniref:diguanylate cyclase domain-containing protein n=1 Tax=Clostridium sp. TaxID=1506 RepID=UPI003D6CC02A
MKVKMYENKFINITVSIGVAMYPESTLNLKELKVAVDIDLYKAKENGRNRVYYSGYVLIYLHMILYRMNKSVQQSCMLKIFNFILYIILI